MIDAVHLIPNASIETIPVGHGIHTAATDQFLTSLRSFITSS